LDPRRDLGERVALDNALFLERAQAQRERARADAAQRTLKFAEPRAAFGQVTDEEQRPLAADDVRGPADGTGRIGRHRPRLYQVKCRNPTAQCERRARRPAARTPRMEVLRSG